MPSQATDVRYIFLVGGFAESKALQHRVRNELEAGGRRVIVPLRPGLAVVKGAVMLGLGASERFASRLAKQTYGVDCSRRFDPSKLDHDGRRTFQRMDRGELVTYVGDHFSPIVAKGTRVALRQVHRGSEIRKSSEHHASAFKVFTCQSPGTKWVTNAGVVKIGKVAYKARKGDRVRVDLCFGASEIRATVVNVTTGAETPAVIQYDFRRIASDLGAAGGGGAGELAAVRWFKFGSGDLCACGSFGLFPPWGVATTCCHAGRFRLPGKAQPTAISSSLVEIDRPSLPR